MRLSVRYVDVMPSLLKEEQPVVVLERVQPGGVYHVLNSTALSEKPHWVLTRTGPKVRVPLTAYRTAQRAMSALAATAMQIALAAVASFRQHTADEPIEALVVLGHHCDDLVEEGVFRCFIGVAFRTA